MEGRKSYTRFVWMMGFELTIILGIILLIGEFLGLDKRILGIIVGITLFLYIVYKVRQYFDMEKWSWKWNIRK